MASVIHGFIYNKDAFDELGLQAPKTEDEFFAVLDKIKADGTYIPMAMGTNDQWEAATMGYQNIGPNYWKGEEGRQALIKGTQKLTDEDWVAPYARARQVEDPISATASRRRPIPTARTSSPSAAPRSTRPARGRSRGSTRRSPSFEMGAFPPPVQNAGDDCYISDHADIGMGLNAASPNPDAAKAFLEWVGSPEFADALRQRAAGLLPALNRRRSSSTTRWRRSSSAGARPASRRSARPTRSCRAARRTSRTRPGTPRPTSSTAPRRPKPRRNGFRTASQAGTSSADVAVSAAGRLRSDRAGPIRREPER